MTNYYNLLTNRLPCFDLNFYDRKINTFPKQLTNDKFKWIILKKYAETLSHAYLGMMYRLIESLDGKKSALPLDRYTPNMTELRKIEHELFKSFDTIRSNCFASTIKKSKHLTQLVETGAKTWLIYYNMYKADANNFNCIKSLVELQNDYQNNDWANEDSSTDIYARHQKARAYLKKHVEPYFTETEGFIFEGKKPARIYKNIDAVGIYKNILSTFNGYDVDIHEAEMSAFVSTVKNPQNLAIMNFYDSYADMKYVIKRLKYIDANCKTYFSLVEFLDNLAINPENRNRDIMETAVKYTEMCSDLIGGGAGNIPDFNYMKNTLQFWINKNSDLYIKIMKKSNSLDLTQFKR